VKPPPVTPPASHFWAKQEGGKHNQRGNDGSGNCVHIYFFSVEFSPHRTVNVVETETRVIVQR